MNPDSKHRPDVKPNNPTGDKKPSTKIERRQFLKLGASGAVASVAAACSIGVTKSERASPGTTATSAAAAPDKISAIDIAGVIDPAKMRAESWQEPWTWRPGDWHDSYLDLNVIRNQNPGPSQSPGTTRPSLYSYNGISPAPTIRIAADGELRIRLRNTMGKNEDNVPVGPAPDAFEFKEEFRMEICALAEEQVRGGDPLNPRRCLPFLFPEQVLQKVNVKTRPGWNIGGHINGDHGAHTTNLHTHGLHVSPDTNADGSHSDNIFLRIIPRADWQARVEEKGSEENVLTRHEHVGQLDYKFELPFTRGEAHIPHPPGTHWYHPHSHGSTHNQVASGMAGFLIVEGDVDEAINFAMCGKSRVDTETPTGPYDYRERLIFIQRVEVGSQDMDAGPKKQNLRFPPLTAVNGVRETAMFRMRPGAVERWRVINGSVDGAGTKRFMVLEGQFVQLKNRIWKVVVEQTGEGDEKTEKRRLEPVSEQDIEDAKVNIQMLSMDGITLVSVENGKVKHRIRDLAKINAGTDNPFARKRRAGESEYESRLKAFESVFRDGDSLRRSFNRPDEIYMTNANRADVFFKAPPDAAGKVFTVFAKEAHIHTDNMQGDLQKTIANPEFVPFRPMFDVAVAYIHVAGKPVEGGDFNIQSLNRHLPEVPELLQPVSASELKIPPHEAAASGAKPGAKRCRTLSYSGTGPTFFPVIPVPPGFTEQHADLENVLWVDIDGTRILMPNRTGTMGINPEFDLSVNPEPGPARKFAPHDPMRPKMLLDTAEEWVVYNCSQMLWVHSDLERFPQPGAYRTHYESFPIGRAEGQRRFAKDPEFRISSKAVDHPFHIHVNPMWVLRIDVPDENGDLHNILPEPMWMDTVAIPRNGGRVVFRSRFEDFTGLWINHCHILRHEDNGMMQIVECTDDPVAVNYKTRLASAEHHMSGKAVSDIYPPPSLDLMYRQNFSFIDPGELGYQEFPGFEWPVPKIRD
jgi:FtsP/CotA-like multicopper oxidase with cupredoxin domain